MRRRKTMSKERTRRKEKTAEESFANRFKLLLPMRAEREKRYLNP
jgi:hypothetical protein